MHHGKICLSVKIRSSSVSNTIKTSRRAAICIHMHMQLYKHVLIHMYTHFSRLYIPVGLLLEGLNFRLICEHPTLATLQTLAE